MIERVKKVYPFLHAKATILGFCRFRPRNNRTFMEYVDRDSAPNPLVELVFGGKNMIFGVGPQMSGEGRAGDACKNRVELGL